VKNSYILLIILLPTLANCATPTEVANSLEYVASQCLIKGEIYLEAEECLKQHGIKMEKINWKKGLDTYRHGKCKPSDRHFLVGACASLHVSVKNGQIEEWSIAKGYDGP